MLNRNILEQQRLTHLVGCRVELLQMDDVTAPPVGMLGAVMGIDDTGLIMVDWDNDSGLNVIYGIDHVQKVTNIDR